jgi:hypothetical protein
MLQTKQTAPPNTRVNHRHTETMPTHLSTQPRASYHKHKMLYTSSSLADLVTSMPLQSATLAPIGTYANLTTNLVSTLALGTPSHLTAPRVAQPAHIVLAAATGVTVKWNACWSGHTLAVATTCKPTIQSQLLSLCTGSTHVAAVHSAVQVELERVCSNSW